VELRVGGAVLSLPIHVYRGWKHMLFNAKTPYYKLVVPERYYSEAPYKDDARVQAALKQLFGGERSVELAIEASDDQKTVSMRSAYLDFKVGIAPMHVDAARPERFSFSFQR
jgi:hypothetical protein